jgi:2-C-methyl-D-erythritol 2,4-cyclodiphosphate synthase
MNAMLTAAGLRDIGVLFPSSVERYLNINSLILLDKVYKMISEQGYAVNNVSAEIIAEKPKLANYIPKMKENLATICRLNHNNISIAATTSEGLGITGQEKGIAAYAVVSIIKSR